MDNKLLRQIIDGASDYADVDMPMHKCIEKYCLDNGIPEEVGDEAYDLASRDNALEAGIPLSVIEGKTKLTDHFSQEYIDQQCNKDSHED